MIAFGTGDREDLWNNDSQTGRFFVFLDDTDKLPKAANGDLRSGPLDETDFRRIGVDDTLPGINIESLPSGQRGWYLVLDANERVINDAFALSGVTFFSTFKPRSRSPPAKQGRSAVRQDGHQPDLHRLDADRGPVRAAARTGTTDPCDPVLRGPALRDQPVRRAGADQERVRRRRGDLRGRD